MPLFQTMSRLVLFLQHKKIIPFFELRKQKQRKRVQLIEQLKAIQEVSIDTSESMNEAAIKLDKVAYSLVITNLRLMDGWVSQKFMNYLEYNDHNLLIVTGLNDLNHLYDLQKRRNTQLLFKPFSHTQLKKVLSHSLSEFQ